MKNSAKVLLTEVLAGSRSLGGKGKNVMPNEAEDLLDWICESREKITVEEASKVVDKIFHCKLVIDPEDRRHNRFFYEICPLLAIGQHVGTSKTKIEFKASTDGFDGLIINPQMNEQKIEITAAIDGYQESLRMELLQKCGIAPAFDPIDAKGTKKKREFGNNCPEVATPARCRDTKTLELLRSAFEKKKKKSEGNVDYHGAWLGIVFDDYTEPCEHKKKGRFDPICIDLIRTTVSKDCVFSRIFCLGVSRRYIFDSDGLRQ